MGRLSRAASAAYELNNRRQREFAVHAWRGENVECRHFIKYVHVNGLCYSPLSPAGKPKKTKIASDRCAPTVFARKRLKRSTAFSAGRDKMAGKKNGRRAARVVQKTRNCFDDRNCVFIENWLAIFSQRPELAARLFTSGSNESSGLYHPGLRC